MKLKCKIWLSMSLLVLLGAAASPAWGLLSKEEPYVEQARGHILYFPTVNHADTSVAIQAPSGIIPTSNASRVATAWDSAGRMLELASAYRYTGDEKYLTALARQWSGLEAVKNRYRYYPDIIGLDGAAYSVKKGDDVIRDGIFLSRALLGLEELADNVTAKREVHVQGYVEALPGECPGGDCDRAKEEPSCPYESVSPEGGEKLRFLCSEGASTLLEAEYSLPLSKLSGPINASDINVVAVRYRGKEVAIGGGGLTGIRLELLPYAKGDMLRAIAEEHLYDREMRWGFQATSVSSVLRFPRALLGYQAKLVLIGEDSPPWGIVRYGEDREARDYLRLTGEHSLLRGALYLEGLARVDATHSYEFTGKGSMEYALGDDWRITGSRAVYAPQGDKPRFEGITLEYRPVVDRRIHIAGTMDALLEAKFGSSARVLGYADTVALPSGVYSVTALREKIHGEESLRGEVSAWKPTPYRDAEELQFATLSLLESEKLYKEAIRERDPVMFYIAADNLLVHSPRSTASKAVLALLSLDPAQSMSLAEELGHDPRVSPQQVLRVFGDFRVWYSQETLERAVRAVRGSLEEDAYSPELEEILMYLALEAGRTNLDSREALGDLYEGYRDYFGPHTKSYENLARMAKHIPVYRDVVEEIESGDYAGARSTLSALPPGMVKEVFSERLEVEDRKLADLKAGVIEAVKAGEYPLAHRLAQEHEDLARAANASDPVVNIIWGVAEGVVTGKFSPETARRMLSNLDAFSMWRAEEKPAPATGNLSRQEEAAPQQPEPQEKERLSLDVVLVVGAAVVVLVVAAVMLKRRRDRPDRR